MCHLTVRWFECLWNCLFVIGMCSIRHNLYLDDPDMPLACSLVIPWRNRTQNRPPATSYLPVPSPSCACWTILSTIFICTLHLYSSWPQQKCNPLLHTDTLHTLRFGRYQVIKSHIWPQCTFSPPTCMVKNLNWNTLCPELRQLWVCSKRGKECFSETTWSNVWLGWQKSALWPAVDGAS